MENKEKMRFAMRCFYYVYKAYDISETGTGEEI
jgi:hypothetical protein